MILKLKLILAGLCLIILCQSCVKDPGVLPPPVILPVESVEQTPFSSFLDSLVHLGDTVLIMTQGIQKYNPFFPKSEIPGQEIIGFSFRSAVAGRVTSLGTFLPGVGYSHHVILWDSVTNQILAQADVPTISAQKFTYVSLAFVNQAVDIQPNHPYIVSFNTLANGSALNTSSTGNGYYFMNGIYHFFDGGNTIDPIIPFTKGDITFNSFYEIPYNNFSTRLSPTQLQGQTYMLTTIFGVCDIGFIPK